MHVDKYYGDSASYDQDDKGDSKRGQTWLRQADPYGLFRCLLGNLGARIVRDYIECFLGCLLSYNDGAGVVPREGMRV